MEDSSAVLGIDFAAIDMPTDMPLGITNADIM